MKKIALFLTLVSLAAIAAAGWWYNNLTREEFDTTRWLSDSFENVQSIRVRAGKNDFTLEASADGWQARIPGASGAIVARAIPKKVLGYLVRLSELEPHRSIGGFDRGGPEEYGLDDPDLRIDVTFSKAGTVPLSVKMTSDGGGTIFGWNSRSPGLVYEFGSKVVEELGQTVDSFLDTWVLKFDEENVAKIQLVQPFGSSWLVEKRKEGYYFALPGYLKDKPASDSALKLYVHSLALLRADHLLMDQMETENRIPALTIRIWTGKDKEPSSVEFFTIADAPEVYLGKSSWLTVPFTLDAQSVGLLVKSAFDVQGRTVIKLDLGTVARLIVAHGENHYAVERGDTGWRLMDRKKDLPGIDMFLWRFTELQFEALPLNNLPDTAVKLMYCKLQDRDGETLKELTFYADPKLPQGQCWMKNGGGMYYPVSSRLLKDLQGMFPSGKTGADS
ncbi:DUF4340 domain-containing protein [Pseudodesulfovibrio cashew]|uniref:DUF4340 domain-containing protein n=1 Tax=Pseudodesulfovibrio cashew TaxID=2678688 RepID=A0A6I6JDU0_9BACT|nr:DUF4340 domain-containing protein [Pseudodesulfovibrio cashew]QGY41016.1 DUF4340 domain-containing protein [Pseudodesulfovibrio cashew]